MSSHPSGGGLRLFLTFGIVKFHFKYFRVTAELKSQDKPPEVEICLSRLRKIWKVSRLWNGKVLGAYQMAGF